MNPRINLCGWSVGEYTLSTEPDRSGPAAHLASDSFVISHQGRHGPFCGPNSRITRSVVRVRFRALFRFERFRAGPSRP